MAFACLYNPASNSWSLLPMASGARRNGGDGKAGSANNMATLDALVREPFRAGQLLIHSKLKEVCIGITLQLVRPEEVSLCILISALVVPPAEELGWGVQFDGHQALRRLAVLLLQEVKGSDTVTYTPLRELLVRLQQELELAGGVLATALVRVLQTLQSPDDIITVFESFSVLLIRTGAAVQAPNAAGLGGIDPQSPLGLFLRRCRVAFNQLPFEAVVQLHGAIQLDLQLAITGQGSAGQQPASLREQRSLDAFLHDRVLLAERQGSSLPMAAIEQQLQALAPLAQDLPRLQYARLSNALQHQDYLGALDALHHYFDYQGSAGAAGLGAGGAAVPASETRKGRYQSALLSLSAAHASFGHPQEALQALNETLRVCQQGGDAWCLLHALAALCRTLDMTGGVRPGRVARPAALDFGAAEEQLRLVRLLRRCLERSVELQCPHLATFARVALTRFTLQHATELDEDRAAHSVDDPGATSGGAAASAAAIGVQRALRAAKNLANASAMAAATPGSTPEPKQPGAPPQAAGQPGPRPGGVGDLFNTAAVFGPLSKGSERASAAAVAQTAGTAHLLQAGAWRQHGCAPLSIAHALTYLCCYSANGRAEERALAYAQLAGLVSERRGFGAGEAVLALAEEGQSGQSERPLAAARLALAHRRTLNQGDTLAAEMSAQELELLADPGEGMDADLKLQAAAMHVNVLLASGALCKAHMAAGRLFDASMAAGLPESAVQALLLLARAHSDAGDALGAFPYVLAALLHCRLLGLDILGAEAAVALARLWGVLLPPVSCSSGTSNTTDTPSSRQTGSKLTGAGTGKGGGGAAHARVLLQDVMPLVMAHGGLELQGEAQLAAADALLAGVGPGGELASVAGEAGQLLRRAAAAFEGAMCWGRAAGAQSLLAHMCHAVGDVAGRDDAAVRALDLAERVAAVDSASCV